MPRRRRAKKPSGQLQMLAAEEEVLEARRRGKETVADSVEPGAAAGPVRTVRGAVD
jgi:hypothetical protein